MSITLTQLVFGLIVSIYGIIGLVYAILFYKNRFNKPTKIACLIHLGLIMLYVCIAIFSPVFITYVLIVFLTYQLAIASKTLYEVCKLNVDRFEDTFNGEEWLRNVTGK